MMMNKKMLRIICAAMTALSCGIMLMSCDVYDDTSSGPVPAYKSSPTASRAASEGDESSQAASVVTSDGASQENTSSEQSRPESEAPSAPSDIGNDVSDNKSGDIIYIEGVGYDILSVVNKNYTLPEDCKEPKLVTLPESTTDREDRTYKADARAAEPLAAFLDAARDEGYRPIVYSSYRTYEYQRNLYEKALTRWLDNNPGSTREQAIAAVTQTAPTGSSEHCIGLAFDIYSWSAHNEFGELAEGFENYDLCKWMLANAHKYGFILRYPKDKEDITMIAYEPWHFRYVGVEAATEIYEQGLCLEEYTGKVIA